MLAESRVTIVDDDADHRRSMRNLIESVNLPCRTFPGGTEFLEADYDLPGCIVLDIRLPGVSGLRVQQVLHDRACMTPVIVMTGHADVTVAVEAMKQGAFDFLEKPATPSRVIDQIHAAIEHNRQVRLRSGRCREVFERLASLSGRERQVVRLITEGLANKQIAIELGVSQRTVETHRANVMEKMGVTNLAQLVRTIDHFECCPKAQLKMCPLQGHPGLCAG